VAAGITVYNDSNVVQVDESYRNMVLIKSGQFTANLSATHQDLWWSSLQTVWARTTPNAIMAVRTPYPGLCLGPGSYRDGRKVCSFFYPANQTVTFQYYIYDLVSPSLSDRVGMQVFNSQSVLVYSAYDIPLRVIDYVDTRDKPSIVDVIYRAPHLNVAACCIAGGYMVDVDGVDVELSYARTYWSGLDFKGYTVNYVNDAPGAGPTGYWGTGYQNFLMVDVSNVPLNYERSQ